MNIIAQENAEFFYSIVIPMPLLVLTWLLLTANKFKAVSITLLTLNFVTMFVGLVDIVLGIHNVIASGTISNIHLAVMGLIFVLGGWWMLKFLGQNPVA